jgi:hypothetical protein
MKGSPCSLAKGETKLPVADRPNPKIRARTATVKDLLFLRTVKKDWDDSWEAHVKDSGRGRVSNSPRVAIPAELRKKTEKPNVRIIISPMAGPMANPVTPDIPNIPIPSFNNIGEHRGKTEGQPCAMENAHK